MSCCPSLHAALQPVLLIAQLLTCSLYTNSNRIRRISHVELLRLVLEARACTAPHLLMGCQDGPLLHRRCPCSSHMMFYTCLKLICTLLRVQGRHAERRAEQTLAAAAVQCDTSACCTAIRNSDSLLKSPSIKPYP
jgi:hypothetical protein